jgi:predicted transcriptional regulator
LSREDGMTVKQTKDQLNREYAYTTVMTTLDRLYRKGLLRRRMQGLAYKYRCARCLSALEKQMLNDVITTLLACRQLSYPELATALVQSFATKNSDLLEALRSELEKWHGRGEHVSQDSYFGNSLPPS